MPRRLGPWSLLVAALLGSLALRARPVAANDPVPVVSGPLALDGRLDEPAWEDARRLESGTVTLPLPAERPEDEPRTGERAPDVRVLVHEGRLWIGLSFEDAPGGAIGLRAMIAGPDAATAADAVALSYSPQDLRSPRFVARGPRGVGRAVYRLEGAADVSRPEGWSLEVALALEDLGPTALAGPLRVAVVVATRVPNLVSWSPPAAAWAGPARWHVLSPPGAGWPTHGGADEARIAREEREDRAKEAAWLDYLRVEGASAEALLRAAGVAPDEEGRVSREAVRTAVDAVLLDPLRRAAAARADLADVHVVRGDVLRRLGFPEEALAAYGAARERMPGSREALYGIWVGVRAPGVLVGEPGGPTDYARAEALAVALAEGAAAAGSPIARDGAAFAHALLDVARGEFDAAAARLDPLARRYPFDPALVRAHERARAYAAAWRAESRLREREAGKDDLPLVRLHLEGADGRSAEVLLELFEDDAPNTVRNFVHLAAHGFYDGTAIDQVVPFFAVHGGDPRTAGGQADGPGYAIAREAQGLGGRLRRPFRGVIAMAAAAPGEEGSRFFLTTAAAPHLEGEYAVFGRVLSGQEAVERLRQGDRLRRVEVVRLRPGASYHPVTREGGPAPTPVR